MHYESCKHKLSILQDTLNKYPGLKDKIVPYTWVLRDRKTNQLLIKYVVAGRTVLEAKLIGKLYFTIDPTIPNYERNLYLKDDIIDRLVTVSPMR